MAETLIGLDCGTTGVTAILFAPKGTTGLAPLKRAYREFSQGFPQAGWVEHKAEDILGAVDEVLAELLAHESATSVVGLGLTNQRETVFALDRTRPGEALGPGIVWQDRRTAKRCAELREIEGVGRRIRQLTGLIIDPYFSATKIEWMLQMCPGIRARAEAGEVCFGTVDTLVMAHLLGEQGFQTDPTNASRTMLFDINTRAWSPELCRQFDIAPSWLATVQPSAGQFGTAQIADRAIPVLAVVGDQQAALFGQGATARGGMKCTFGTGLFLLLNAGAKRPVVSERGILTTIALGPKGEAVFALEGSIFMGGAILQWMRDKLGILDDATESEAIARTVPDSGGVTLVPAFTGLGAPYWDPEARAAILGLDRGSGKAHIVRAGLEAIALQNVELLELFRRETGLALETMCVDGGAASNGLLMQLQADLAGLDVQRPRNLEATALGAAVLAGLQLGLGTAVGGLDIERTFVADPTVEREAHLLRWRTAVARVRSDFTGG